MSTKKNSKKTKFDNARLIDARNLNYMSQEELAEELDATQSFVSSLERDLAGIPKKMMDILEEKKIASKKFLKSDPYPILDANELGLHVGVPSREQAHFAHVMSQLNNGIERLLDDAAVTTKFTYNWRTLQERFAQEKWDEESMVIETRFAGKLSWSDPLNSAAIFTEKLQIPVFYYNPSQRVLGKTKNGEPVGIVTDSASYFGGRQPFILVNSTLKKGDSEIAILRQLYFILNKISGEKANTVDAYNKSLDFALALLLPKRVIKRYKEYGVPVYSEDKIGIFVSMYNVPRMLVARRIWKAQVDRKMLKQECSEELTQTIKTTLKGDHSSWSRQPGPYDPDGVETVAVDSTLLILYMALAYKNKEEGYKSAIEEAVGYEPFRTMFPVFNKSAALHFVLEAQRNNNNNNSNSKPVTKRTEAKTSNQKKDSVNKNSMHQNA